MILDLKGYQNGMINYHGFHKGDRYLGQVI